MYSRPPSSTLTATTFPTPRSHDLAIHSASSACSVGSTYPGCLYCESPCSPSTAMPRWLSVGYSLNSTCGSSWKPAFQRCQSASTTWMSCAPCSTSIGRPTDLASATGSRSEEHTSELQSLMRISYAVFCLKKNKNHIITNVNYTKRINSN